MTRTIVLTIVFLQTLNYGYCKQYLYIETILGGCYEPVPTAYYVEVSDSNDALKILANDSELVEFLNRSDKIYPLCEVLCIRDSSITEKVIDKFTKDYDKHRKSYNFIRNEHWGNFHVKIAIVDHELIKYSRISWAHPENAELYEYQNNSIQILIAEKKDFNYAYFIE